ncbi:hypothetical protein NOR_05852 [Metarhizium rileyi]|uniref:Uncharacterized protein n=1 Tax=Metarhizium rileyi (strain RCEF 4871) TaxID=1649241 RepID=A0A167BQA4_METRR|nr:hypothetical protein NOR_05852 [Metarhizium rileyi RCEF 4871]
MAQCIRKLIPTNPSNNNNPSSFLPGNGLLTLLCSHGLKGDERLYLKPPITRPCRDGIRVQFSNLGSSKNSALHIYARNILHVAPHSIQGGVSSLAGKSIPSLPSRGYSAMELASVAF